MSIDVCELLYSLYQSAQLQLKCWMMLKLTCPCNSNQAAPRYNMKMMMLMMMIMMLGLADFGLVIIMMNVQLTCPCSSSQATPPLQSEALLGFQVVLGSRLLLWIVFVLLSVVFDVFCSYISAFMYFAFCLQLTLTVKDSAVFRGLPRSGRKARQEFTLWAVQLYMWWFKFYLSAQAQAQASYIYDIVLLQEYKTTWWKTGLAVQRTSLWPCNV